MEEMEVISGGINWKYYPDAICVTWALVNVRTRMAINLLPGARALTVGCAAWGLYRFVDSYFLSS